MSLQATRTAYRNALKDSVVIRRYTGSTTTRPRFDVRCRAKINVDRAEQLIGTVNQIDYSIIVLFDDLFGKGLALPITTNDKCVVEGNEKSIQFVGERRDEGAIVAYELKVKG